MSTYFVYGCDHHDAGDERLSGSGAAQGRSSLARHSRDRAFGFGEIGSVVRCIELGAEDYLPKPFDPILLRARIGACLEKRHLRDQEARLRTELEEFNKTLEARVQEQVAQLERLGCLKRFFSPQLAELIVSGVFVVDFLTLRPLGLGGRTIRMQSSVDCYVAGTHRGAIEDFRHCVGPLGNNSGFS